MFAFRDKVILPMADLNTPYSIHQALISQHNRLLKLATVLGDDILLPQRVIARERLGRSYEYTIDLISVRDDIELKTLIAQLATLWVQQADRRYLPVNGYVQLLPDQVRTLAGFPEIPKRRQDMARQESR